MKIPILSSLALLAIATGVMADPDSAPLLNKRLDQLEKKVESDQAAGALTQPDADELKREISEVRTTETSEPRLTLATRRDLNEKVSKIKRDLDRKEAQAKALATASPSP